MSRTASALALVALLAACGDHAALSPAPSPSRGPAGSALPGVAVGGGPALSRASAAEPPAEPGQGAVGSGPRAPRPGSTAGLAAEGAQSSPASAASTTSPTSYIVWQNLETGDRGSWGMDGLVYRDDWTILYPEPVSTAWRIVASADFTADGQPDLVWQNLVSGDVGIWPMNGATWSGQHVALGAVPVEWRVAAAGDFTGDGRPDLVWQNTTTGERGLWVMNGTSFGGEYRLLYPQAIDPAWDIAAAADFDGDGAPDLLWQHRGSGERGIWHMLGASDAGYEALSAPIVPPEWEIAAAVDLTGDGKNDLVWQNRATGERAFWRMTNTLLLEALYFPGGPVPLAWDIGAVLRMPAAGPNLKVSVDPPSWMADSPIGVGILRGTESVGGYTIYRGAPLLLEVPAGTYKLYAAQEKAYADGGLTHYYTTASPKQVTVSAGVLADVAFDYALASVPLVLRIGTLPPGVAPQCEVSAGKGGFFAPVAGLGYALTALTSWMPVSCRSVLLDGVIYDPTPFLQTVTTAPALTPYPVDVSYAARTIPEGANLKLTVTLPEGFYTNVTGVDVRGVAHRTVLSGQPVQLRVAPGTHTIVPELSTLSVLFSGVRLGYETPLERAVTVTDGTLAEVAIDYRLVSGILQLEYGGLPDAAAPVCVARPDSGLRSGSFARTETLGFAVGTGEGPGEVFCLNVTSNGITYQPVPASQRVTVTASKVPQVVQVRYEPVP